MASLPSDTIRTGLTRFARASACWVRKTWSSSSSTIRIRKSEMFMAALDADRTGCPEPGRYLRLRAPVGPKIPQGGKCYARNLEIQGFPGEEEFLEALDAELAGDADEQL